MVEEFLSLSYILSCYLEHLALLCTTLQQSTQLCRMPFFVLADIHSYSPFCPLLANFFSVIRLAFFVTYLTFFLLQNHKTRASKSDPKIIKPSHAFQDAILNPFFEKIKPKIRFKRPKLVKPTSLTTICTLSHWCVSTHASVHDSA